MNNDEGGPPMVYPWGQMPYMPYPYQQQTPREEVPARVRVAVQFLSNLAMKTAKSIAVNAMSIEAIDGQELSLREVEAQSAALGMLKRYFGGELEIDGRESQEGRRQVVVAPAGIIVCTSCGGDGQAEGGRCSVCHGKGHLLAFPDVREGYS